MESLLSTDEWGQWFQEVRLPKKVKQVLEAIFFVTWWYIWRVRNNILFGNKLFRRCLIFDDIVTYK